MKSTLTWMVTGLMAAGLVAGCSSGETFSEAGDVGSDDDPVAEERYGTLSAEFDPARSWGESEVDIQAQFLDAQGVAVDSALDALEVWAPRRDLEMEECIVAHGEASSAPGSEPASLELLDVGALDVETTDDGLSLAPRQLPDLLSSFHGVVYGSQWHEQPDAASVDYRPGADYRFRADGSASVGPFDVTLEAPTPLVLVAADGEAIDHRDAVSVASGQDLELVWESDGGEDGEIFIDLAVGFGPEQVRMQCRAPDSGAFSVPAASIEPFRLLDTPVDLEIRRVDRHNAVVDGLDAVDFYFSTVDRIGLRFE